MWETCGAFDNGVLVMQLIEEPAHLLESFAPARLVEEDVKIMKSQGWRELFHGFPGLRNELWVEELWKEWHFVRTIGNQMIPNVVARQIELRRKLGQEPTHLTLMVRSECPTGDRRDRLLHPSVCGSFSRRHCIGQTYHILKFH